MYFSFFLPISPRRELTTTTGYRSVGTVSNPTGSYVKSVYATDFGLVMRDNGGSASTYFCDYGYATGSNRIASVGGNCGSGSICGAFSCVLYNDASYPDSFGGSSLSAKLRVVNPRLITLNFY